MCSYKLGGHYRTRKYQKTELSLRLNPAPILHTPQMNSGEYRIILEIVQSEIFITLRDTCLSNQQGKRRLVQYIFLGASTIPFSNSNFVMENKFQSQDRKQPRV